MEKVYIETTIISHLTARPSSNLQAAAWQEATQKWWTLRRSAFELYSSELVTEEAAEGDPTAAQRRLNRLMDILALQTTDPAIELAEQLISHGPLPEKAAADALHIALCVVNRIDYLLTWNLKHIGNAQMWPTIRTVCQLNGYTTPVICTPQALMGEYADEE